ncbi:MAG: DUF1588 domain-containing protein [Sandaracinaceae bacterium]
MGGWRRDSMGGLLGVVAALGLLACAQGTGLEPLRPPEREPTPPLGDVASVERYAALCASCHGELGEGGFGPPLVDIETEERALAQLIDETMPQDAPESCKGSCADGVAHFIKTQLTSEALRCDGVEPAPRRLRLLNRREYAASVRDLLGLPQGAEEGGDPCPETTFRYDPGGRSVSSVHVAGTFNGWSATAWPMRLEAGVWTLTRSLDPGRHAYKLVLDGGEWIEDPSATESEDDTFGGRNSVLQVRCAEGAAPLDLTASLPVEPRPEGYVYDNSADALQVTSIHLDELSRAAAAAVAHLGEPGLLSLADCAGAPRDACLSAFVGRLGRRAFRRPLTEREAARYEALAADAPSLADAIGVVVRGLLVSPHFLYRSELGVAQGDGTFRLTGFEVASALSYGLWGTTPDDALLDAAEAGALEDPAALEAQAARMLEDPRARPVLAAIVRQWLGVAGVPEQTRVDGRFDDALAAAMIDETEAFALHVVFEGSGRFEELLTGAREPDDAALHALYAEDLEPRVGLLGHASVLTATSHSDQSSPIRRGLFVRQRLLCQTLPPPPADAGGVPDVDPTATTRERFRQHTDEARCAGCHRYIDPVGFGFERYGPIGEWREREGGHPIDARGDMVDVEGIGRGTSAPFESLAELAAILAESEAAPGCFARQAFRFTRGQRETVRERCAVAHVQREWGARDHDVRALFALLYASPDFRIRREASE